jgi:hypothetical protein
VDLISQYTAWDEELVGTGELFDTLVYIKRRAREYVEKQFAEAVGAAVQPEDWFDQCRRLHSGECGERLHHHHRMVRESVGEAEGKSLVAGGRP